MKRTILLLAFLLCTSSMGWATVTIFDFNTTISDGDAYDQVVIKGTGTVVLMDGGSANDVLTMDDAVFNMTAGVVGGLYSHENSQMNISGGSINGASGQGNSTISFQGSIICTGGGSFNDNSSFYVSESAQVDGGWFDMEESSVLHIEGGILSAIFNLEDSASGIISGGTFTPLEFDHHLDLRHEASLIIVGNNVTKRPYNTTDVYQGEVTGNWESGTPFSITFDFDSYSKILIQSPSEVLCANSPTSDLDGDCRVTISDFAIMASEWLDCGLVPESACP